MNRVSAAVAPPSQSTASRSTTSKYSSNLDRSWPPSAFPKSLDHGLQVHLWVPLDPGLKVNFQTRSITASKCISELYNLQIRSITTSKCISKFTLSQPPNASPNPLHHGLQVHLWVTRSQRPNASPNPLDLSLQVHLWVQLDLVLQMHLQTRSISASKCISELHNLQTRSITTSKCISEFNLISASKWIFELLDLGLHHSLQVYFWVQLDHGLQVHLWVTRSRPPNASPNPLDLGLQVHLWVQHDLGLQVSHQTRSITASKYISQFTRSRPPSASRSSLNQASPGAPAITLQYRLQPDWLYVDIKSDLDR